MRKLLLALVSLVSISVYAMTKDVYLCKAPGSYLNPDIILSYETGPEWPSIFLDKDKLDQLSEKAYGARNFIAQIEHTNFYLLNCEDIPEKNFLLKGYTDAGEWQKSFAKDMLSKNIVKEYNSIQSRTRRHNLHGSAVGDPSQEFANGNYTLDKSSHNFLVNNGIESIITTIKNKIFSPQERLWNASVTGELSGVEEALNSGADINKKDPKGDTALEIAVFYGGYQPLAQYLFEKGAIVTEKLRAQKPEMFKKQQEDAEKLETEKRERERLEAEKLKKEKLELEAKLKQIAREEKQVQEQLKILAKEEQALRAALDTKRLLYSLALALKNLV